MLWALCYPQHCSATLIYPPFLHSLLTLTWREDVLVPGFGFDTGMKEQTSVQPPGSIQLPDLSSWDCWSFIMCLRYWDPPSFLSTAWCTQKTPASLFRWQKAPNHHLPSIRFFVGSSHLHLVTSLSVCSPQSSLESVRRSSLPENNNVLQTTVSPTRPLNIHNCLLAYHVPCPVPRLPRLLN